jgi:hypothetical protein
MKTDKEIEGIEIFAGTAWEAGMVKSLLEDSEIKAFLKDEIVGIYYPWYSAPGGAGAVKIFVSSRDYEKARSVVEEFERNSKEIN